VKDLVQFDVVEVDFNVFGQIVRKTGDFHFHGFAVDGAALEFDGRRAFLVQEVDRHVDVDLVALLDPQEVRVGQDRLVGMTLEVLDDDVFFLAIDLQGDDVREEGFVLNGLFRSLCQSVIACGFLPSPP